MDKTYVVPGQKTDWLQGQFEKLNRRAQKLGVPGVELRVLRQWTEFVDRETGTGYKYQEQIQKAEVRVSGETPKLAGWRLVAVVETLPEVWEDRRVEEQNCAERLLGQAFGEPAVRTERVKVADATKLLKTVPGEECPEVYRDRPNDCDHCRTDRRRTEVFVVGHDDGRCAQVGRTCLQDFLGGVSPEALVNYASVVGSLIESLDDEESYFGGVSFREEVVPVECVLDVTAWIIRKVGWVPRSAARFDGRSTADQVSKYLFPRSKYDYEDNKKLADGHPHRDSDKKQAQDAIAWVLSGGAGDSGYGQNLLAAVRHGFVQARNFGLVCSALAAHGKAIERQLEYAKKNASLPFRNEWAGQLKDRLGFVATVESKRYLPGFRDGTETCLIAFRTDDGLILKWFSSADQEWAELNTKIEFTGTVKKHDEYQGRKQTVLTRCSLGLPKGAKGRRKTTGLDAVAASVDQEVEPQFAEEIN